MAENKIAPKKQYCFITNDFGISAKDVSNAYHRRQDIEVFFSLHKTGIECQPFGVAKQKRNAGNVILYDPYRRYATNTTTTQDTKQLNEEWLRK